MTQSELETIIANHQHWIKRDCEGWENMCAILIGVDLKCLDLQFADLRGATLRDVDLSNANLKGANLGGADLRGVDLSGADLSGANLNITFLNGANLSYTNLSNAHLSYTDLSDADLSDVITNEITSFIDLQCPEEGSYIGWKICGEYIVKLLITDDAKRSSATSRECRASKAVVLEIQNLDGNKADITSIHSNHDEAFIYEVGKTVEVKDFDENRWNGCSTGIHHFITRHEAVNYGVCFYI